jgi:hypothetical protein
METAPELIVNSLAYTLVTRSAVLCVVRCAFSQWLVSLR